MEEDFSTTHPEFETRFFDGDGVSRVSGKASLAARLCLSAVLGAQDLVDSTRAFGLSEMSVSSFGHGGNDFSRHAQTISQTTTNSVYWSEGDTPLIKKTEEGAHSTRTQEVKNKHLPPGPLPSTRERGTAKRVGYISSATTLKVSKSAKPKDVVSAQSTASRPRPISTRPMRGVLKRASIVYHMLSR